MKPALSQDSDGPWGILTLANDAVLEWLIALRESLREFGDGLPLRVIPFDDQCDRLVEYLGLDEVWWSRELSAWDEVGGIFYPDSPRLSRTFRKLASFAGPFEKFLFVDSDVLALSPLRELVEAAERADARLVYFDTDVDQVYLPGSLRDTLLGSGRGLGFNSGLFIGKRGDIDREQLVRAVAEIEGHWKEHLVPFGEQAFLNLAVDWARIKPVPAHELIGDVCSTCWPAVGRIEESAGEYRLRDSGRWDEGRRLLFAHWAGYQLSPEMPNRSLWESFRARSIEVGPVSPSKPSPWRDVLAHLRGRLSRSR